jgi:hypothetical protein
MIAIDDDEDIACLGFRRADGSDFFAEIRREERVQLLHALATECFAAARVCSCPSEAEEGEEYLAELRLNSAGVIGDACDQAAAAAAEAAPKYSSPGDLATAMKKRRQRRPRMSVPDGLRTAAEAAARLGCSIKTLNGHVASGALGYVTIGHGRKRPRKMFTDADLTAFIEAQTRKDSLACPSTESRARHSGTSTSSGAVIAFSAQPKPRTNAKPKK